MTLEELQKEVERLISWWMNDASYRPPEDPLQAYALGEADAFVRVSRLLKEINTDSSKKEPECTCVETLLPSGETIMQISDDCPYH